MAPQSVKMRINAFFGDNEIELSLPDDWEVQECLMAGHDRPALTDGEMRQSIRNPVASPRLNELARGNNRVCIVFDDLARPTPVGRILPFILEELHVGGVEDGQIRLICSTGAHHLLNYPELEAKLGGEILERYLVYPHSPWENLVDLGQTSRGTPVRINREFMSCDLRVGVGCIMPHSYAGFSGGGKIVMPGVSGIEAIYHHHDRFRVLSSQDTGEASEYRLDVEEAARLAGLHFKVDVVLNNRREVAALFAGDMVAEHRRGIKVARQIYRTEPLDPVDVLISNPYPCENQMQRATWPIPISLRPEGDFVLVAFCPTGQCLHQLGSRFGTDYGGRTYKPGAEFSKLATPGRCIILAPSISKYDLDFIGWPEKVIRCATWDEALAQLMAKNGPGTRVGVYPYAALQFPGTDGGLGLPTASERCLKDSERRVS